MIWALLAILFFGSGSSSLTEIFDRVESRLDDTVADSPENKARRKELAAILDDAADAAKQYAKSRHEVLDAWIALGKKERSTTADYSALVDRLRADTERFETTMVRKRFALRERMTREEWKATFSARPPAMRTSGSGHAGPPNPVIDGVKDTRIGKLEFEVGFPSKRTTAKLYDELDFQRACQAYLWGLPIVGFAEWQQSVAGALGATDLDYVIYQSLEDKLGILTPNATTPYTIAFTDLARTGPLVVDVPAGASAGGILDFWQRPTTDTGLAGPDQGRGGRYLVLPPGHADITAPGYEMVRSPTFNIFIGHRALDPDPAKAQAWVRSLRLYPYAQRDNPPPTRFLTPDGRPWSQVPPRGLKYWERLADILSREPVAERDRFFMAMLAPLGIEKGKPFAPDARQREILEQGAFIGEAMAMANGFEKRDAGARYRSDSNWTYLIMLDPSQEAEHFSQLDERADYFYQAVATSKGMTSKTPGVGQAYLGAHELAADGSRFDGGNTYRLRVPPNAPAKQFWSVTLYDVDTRSFIQTKEGIADRSSRMDLLKNADGSVDIYMGPKAPAGFEKNWIPTVPGRGWFVLFRLYAPTEAYFDRSWPLPPIERVR